jgi:hypothetical protein
VGGSQAGAELAGNFGGFIAGQAADAAQQRAEIFAIHVVHGKERGAFEFADIVYAADVGVGDLAGEPHLAVKARQPALVA